jgi:oxalate decarboxylase
MANTQQKSGAGAGAANGLPQPIQDGLGATMLGPHNVPLERENPDLLASPQTDAGTIPNLKFSFAAARNRLLTGGWSREVTVRELPAAKELAGVNMRLKPGGIRELHWHKEAEWAYMLAGRCRITAVDQNGRTFLLTDWLKHTPRSVLAKNFGVPQAAFANLPTDPDYQRYIFNGTVPGPLTTDAVRAPAGSVPTWFSHRMLAQDPIKVAGGQVRITDSSNFPAASTIAAALLEIEPGGMRELHWHPNADEWQYYISGRGRMTVFASSGKARTFDYQAGDVGLVPFAMGHYVENTGDETLRLLALFRSDHYADVSLNQWLALTPPELVQAHLNVDQQTMGALSAHKDKPLIVK